MKELALQEILEATGGSAVPSAAVKTIGEISTDTRSIAQGSLFIPLVGENFNGHRFIDEAFRKGAALSLASEAPADESLKDRLIMVGDTLKAYQAIAACYRKKFSIPVIAVTGSNGKTTTKDLIAGVMSQKYRVLKTAANFNNEIGVPKTLLELTPDTEMMVVEMAMRGPGQIRELAEIVQPDHGVITNIGEAHFELLGSYEAIADAKAELLQCLPAKGAALLNSDDRWFDCLVQKSSAPVYSFGQNRSAALSLVSCEAQGVDGFSIRVSYKEEEYGFYLPFLGFHNVYNSLAAILAAFMHDLSPAHIQAGLRSVQITGKRMEKIMTADGITIVNDTYNASPSSVEQALKTLSVLDEKGKKVVVLGDMRELGDIAEESHRRIGRLVAALSPDYLVTLGEMARWIDEGAADEGMPRSRRFFFESRDDAMRKVDSLLSPGDIMLVKASRLMKFEDITEYVLQQRNRTLL